MTVRNRNRARNLAEGLAGQNLEYLRELIFGSKTRAKFKRLRMWPYIARDALARERKFNFAADMFREHADKNIRLPGYFRTWVSKTHNVDDKVFLKGEVLKDMIWVSRPTSKSWSCKTKITRSRYTRGSSLIPRLKEKIRI